MAALQPIVGGLPFSERSFADILQSKTSTPHLPLTSATAPTSSTDNSSMVGTHKGFPAIYINDSRWSSLAGSFHWTLIGKFSHGFNKRHPETGRPPVDRLQKHFEAMDLKSKFSIGLLDNRHLLIQLCSEEDYLRLYSRVAWNIGKVTMRTFKWTPEFHVEKESSLVPVWITLPRLPIHLFSKSILFEIGSLVGLPLRMDAATAALKRPSLARLQVEIDLLQSRPTQIWIGIGDRGGFWQNVEYEHVPSYCQKCWHVGHDEKSCSLGNSDRIVSGLQSNAKTQPWQLKEATAPKANPLEASNPKATPSENPQGQAREDSRRVTFQELEPEKICAPTNDALHLTEVVPSLEPGSAHVEEVVSVASSVLAAPIAPNADASKSVGSSQGIILSEVGVVGHQNENSSQHLLSSTASQSTVNSIKPVLDASIANPQSSLQFSGLTQSIEHPSLPVIFCGDTTDSEDAGEIIVEPLPSTQQPASSCNVVPFSKLFSAPLWCPSAPALSQTAVSLGETSARPNNVPKDYGKTVPGISSLPGRTLPQSFQPTYNFDATDDDSNSWRTLNSAEEDADEEDSSREDSMEDFLDGQKARDDTYLEERRNRQTHRERETVLMRRGRGRPLGSRTIIFSDAEPTLRQSGRNNKGIPPKHFEPGL